MILVDDHLLLRTLVGSPPDGMPLEHVATTTAWWWRAISPLALPRSGQHSRLVLSLSEFERNALWEAMCRVGQPGSLIEMPELKPLGRAMAWLARTDGLNRLAAEVVAAAMDLTAAVWVRYGNEGRLVEMSRRYGFELEVA